MPISKQTEETVLQFLETASALERDLDRALSSIRGISFSEYRLLRTLAGAPNGMPRIDLAQRVGLTASAVTRALKPLEKMGYATSVRGARDARQSLTGITTAGVELLSDAHGVLKDVISTLPVSELPADEAAALKTQLQNLRRK